MGPMDATLARAHGKLAAQGSSLGTAFGASFALKAAAFAAFGAAAYGIKKAVEAASHLNETIQKTGVVFGDQTKIVEEAANRMATTFGVSKREFLDAASAIGLIAKASGLSQQAAAKMGSHFTELAADVASFYDIPVAAALEKIEAGLVGEVRPLRELGVLLSEEAVKQEAVRQGIAKAGQELDDQTKVQIRAILITRGLKDATGDLERTHSSFANQSRELRGRLENLAAQIGTSLLPSFQRLITFGNSLVISLSENWESILGAFESFRGRMSAGIDALGIEWNAWGGNIRRVFNEFVDSAKFLYNNWDLIMKRLGVSMAAFWVHTQERVAYGGEVFMSFMSWLGSEWKNLFIDLFSITSAFFLNLGHNIRVLTAEIKEWIESGFTSDFQPKFIGLFEGLELRTKAFVAPAMKQLSDFSDQLKEIDDQIAANEKKRAEGHLKPHEKEKLKKENEKLEVQKRNLEGAGKEKSTASLVGLEEFRNQILTGALGGSEAKQTADNTRRTANAVEQMAKNISAEGAKLGIAAGPA